MGYYSNCNQQFPDPQSEQTFNQDKEAIYK